MLSIQDREIAITIVNALVEYGLTDNLAQYGENSTRDWFLDNDLKAADFCMRSGATKVCIEHDDLCNWVIKVGFTTGVKLDYAALEYENYLLAKYAGLERYFPETICLGEFGGRAFYIQEAADCDEDVVSSVWYERLRDEFEEGGVEYSADQIYEELDGMDDDQKAFLTFRDSELCNFLWENQIADLHEGNFGYIGDKMVIIDFAGYMG